MQGLIKQREIELSCDISTGQYQSSSGLLRYHEVTGKRTTNERTAKGDVTRVDTVCPNALTVDAYVLTVAYIYFIKKAKAVKSQFV